MSSVDPSAITNRTEGLNRVLSALGQSPVASFPVAGNQALLDLETVFDEVTKEVLLHKWNFNTEIRELSPGAGPGYVISMPTGILDMDPVDKNLDFVVRSSDVYDKTRNTTNFQGMGPFKFECLRGLTFSECPEPVKGYIIARTASEYTRRYEGENEYYAVLQQREMEALAKAQSYEFRTRDRTLFDSNPALARLHRYRYRTWY